MSLARQLSAGALALVLAAPAFAADPTPTTVPNVEAGGIASPEEIPYYLRKLEEAKEEGDRVSYVKIIHDAVVNADLSNKKVIKTMDPIVDHIRADINAKLDEPYLEGQSMWLASAVAYYERERLRPVVDVPESDWMPNQTASNTGRSISTYPEKILLYENGKTHTVVESSGIHEAIISPDGRTIAFFRRADKEDHAEVWVTHLKNLKRKKIADLPSCHTILFSLDGDRLFAQEQLKSPDSESMLWSVSASGGRPKAIGKVNLLNTIVAKGRHKGELVVYKLTPHHLGTTMLQCPFVIDEKGKEVGRIKGSPCR